MRCWISASLCAALGAASAPAIAAEQATVAWLRDGRVEMRTLSPQGAPTQGGDTAATRVPLGSLWKLWVFAYLTERNAREPSYECRAQDAARDNDERYCCNPGESVGRAQALSRSCAPYFSPARLGIAGRDWRAQWKQHAAMAPLADLGQLKPETEIAVGDLLQALAAIPEPARNAARAALLETGVEGYGREAWTRLGTGMRYKTYSWHRDGDIAFGGAAGWLADGTPFWFGARGSSKTALAQWAPQLAAALPTPRWRDTAAADGANAGCVDVDFFTRYPLRAVWHATAATQIKPGVLKGRYRAEFVNGNWLTFTSRGELTLDDDRDSGLAITGRFPLNDYVARVVDREGSAKPAEAARALAIAARTYLLQNSRFEQGCHRIQDSSRTQRVSPNPPSDAALAAAWFTDAMMLTGTSVRYHRDVAGPNQLAWRDAVGRAGEGWDFERILRGAYPQAVIATLNGREECARLDAAESWLTRSASGWRQRLEREPGFEPLAVAPRICSLDGGRPYSDQARLRIYVRGWQTQDERVTLAHEYLHLAFRFHPHGADEHYIERLARQLTGS